MFLLLNLLFSCAQSVNKKRDKRGSVSLAPSVRAQSVTVGKTGLWEDEVAGHLVSIARKQKESWWLFQKTQVQPPGSTHAAQFPVTPVTGFQHTFLVSTHTHMHVAYSQRYIHIEEHK